MAWFSSWSSWQWIGTDKYNEKYRKKILKKDREEQGDAHELLTSSCDDSRARLVRMAVYGIREVRASERVSERVSPGGESEHPGVPFYRLECSARGHQKCYCSAWSVPNMYAKDNVSFACTVHANGRCLITVSLNASACKWTVRDVLHSCMHAWDIFVCVHCYVFLHVGLLVLVICARKI